MRDVTSVLPTTLQNLKAAARFRPFDMVNWSRLVKPLREGPRTGSEFDLLGMLFHMFTRMAFDYTPQRPAGVTPLPWRVNPGTRPAGEPAVGLFADAPEHLSGVATTLHNWNIHARRRGLPFRVHSAGDNPVIEGAANFPQTGTFKLAAYEGLSIRMTDVSAALDYARQSDIDVFHLSTPGPVGLIGLLAARARGCPVTGTFHTHFPSYVARLTGDPLLEDVTWNFMTWFYGQMDRVAAPSTSVRDELITRGLAPERVIVVGRGVDASAFSPAFRDAALRASWGCGPDTRVLLYVGRLSREKNLDVLVEAFRLLCRTRNDLRLVFVGDGPYHHQLRERTAALPVVFAGTRRGEELARHYASADLFLFPSETDTLGNVVLEAQASGLPVIVSSKGGPRDCVQDGASGIILPDTTPDALADAAAGMTGCMDRLRQLQQAARQHMRRFTHEAAFDAFWSLHHCSRD